MGKQYQKGKLVMDYLQALNAGWITILDAICDENLEQSYQLIKEEPNITLKEFMKKMNIEEEEE